MAKWRNTVLLVLCATAICVVYFSAHICISQIKHDHHDKIVVPGVGPLGGKGGGSGSLGAAHEEIRLLRNQIKALKAEAGKPDDGASDEPLGDDDLPPVHHRRANGQIKRASNKGAVSRHGNDFVPTYAPKATLSLIVLCRNEFESLEYSLGTWTENGLIDYVDEVLIFFNNLSPEYVPRMEKIQFPKKVRKISSPINVSILTAINWLVGNATSDFCLFLEKDFRLIEKQKQMQEQLDIGVRMLDRNEAQVIRYRHRKFPGEPHYADYIFKGREAVILRQQPNLLCHIVHWLKDPTRDYPDKIWKCVGEPKMFCTRAEYCGWTNNPQMFAREWWVRDMKPTMDAVSEGNPTQDLEYFTNWNPRVWTPRGFIVALGDGLFEHKELGEHAEVDYSSMRTRVFGEDRDALAKIEAKKQAQLAEDKALGVTHLDGFLTQAQELLRVKYKQGPQFPFSNVLLPPYTIPDKGAITVVTCLFNLARDRLTDPNQKRNFSMYTQALERWLTIPMPKIVYCEQAVADEFKSKAAQTEFRVRTIEDMEKLLGPNNYERLTLIRTDEKWFKQGSGWLKDSPQAMLKDYNSIVMSKIFLLNEAAKENPHNTPYFVFVDVKHNCLSPERFNMENMNVFFEHMNGAFLMTYYKYGPNDEVHGFEWKAMNRYSNRVKDSPEPVKVVRGGVFGGTAPYISAVADIYQLALDATLRDGVMGTEENIFSILLYNFPQLFHEFSNDDACGASEKDDRSCPGFENPHNNCALFEWAYTGPPAYDAPKKEEGSWLVDTYKPPSTPPKSRFGEHKYWRVRVTADNGEWEWAVHEIQLWNMAGQNMLAIDQANEVTVSTNAGGAWGQAADDNDRTFWDLPTPQNVGNTLEISCKKPVEIHTVRVLQHNHRKNAVDGIAVEYSDDGADWKLAEEANPVPFGEWAVVMQPK